MSALLDIISQVPSANHHNLEKKEAKEVLTHCGDMRPQGVVTWKHRSLYIISILIKGVSPPLKLQCLKVYS